MTGDVCIHELALGTCSLCRTVRPETQPRETTRLYAWQAEALVSWRGTGRSGIVEAVTGTGKTQVGIEAVREALDAERRALVLVPTLELQDQWVRNMAQELGLRVGRLGGGGKDSLRTHHVVIAVVHSAARFDLPIPDGSLVIADECHRYAADTFRLALDERYEWRLGLTATLERPDGQHNVLERFFGGICYRIGYAAALADGAVTPFAVALVGADLEEGEAVAYRRVSDEIKDAYRTLVDRYYFPTAPAHLFVQAVKVAAADTGHWAHRVAQWFLGRVNARKQLLAQSRAKAIMVAEMAPAMRAADGTLIFTESVDAAEMISDWLREEGVRAEALHSRMKDWERTEVFDRFRNGALEAVLAPRLIDEGVDVPAADLAIVVAASQTKRQMIQRMGRVLRRKEDGRLARMAILHLRGTTEDPAVGAHEGFLSEVTDVADDIATFGPDELEDALVFLATTDPLRPPPPPRYEGDPERPVRRVRSDDEVSVVDFYALS